MFGGALRLGVSTLLVDGTGLLDMNNNYANTSGGALYDTGRSNITIAGNAVFEDNISQGTAGGVYLYIGSELDVPVDGSMTVSRNVAGSPGGGMYSIRIGFSVQGQVLFSENVAEGSGGGVSIDSSIFEVAVAGQAMFMNNSAVTGGGIATSQDSFVDMSSALGFVGDGVTLLGNNASSSGGGIYAESSTQFELEGTQFLSNFAGETGAALSLISAGTGLQKDAAVVSECLFVGNEAGEAGGAAFVAGGYVVFSDSTFDGNTAGMRG